MRTESMLTENRVAGSGSLRLNLATGPETGPPLLFLHGVCRRWQDFLPMIPAIGCRRQALGWDARGHGESDRSTTPSYLVADYVQDAVAVLRGLPRPAAIFGHSMGAMVALGAAALAPECVQGVILEDPPFSTMGAEIASTSFIHQFVGMKGVAERSGGRTLAEIARDVAEIRVAPPDGAPLVRLGDVRDPVSVRFSASCLMRMDPAVLQPVVDGRWLEGYDLDALARQVQCPVLLLRGDEARGGMLRADDADRLQAGLKECVRIEFPGTGHLIHWMQLEATIRHTTAFLETL